MQDKSNDPQRESVVARDSSVQTTREPWQFYKEHASGYDLWKYTEGVIAFQSAEKQFLIDHIVPGSRVIDIGCGTGEHLLTILDKHCKITGVNFVQTMIDIARQKVGSAATFICEDVRLLKFPPNSFDYAVCFCTLPNLDDFDLVLGRIAGYSKSLIISIYDWESRFELLHFYQLNSLHPRIDEKHRQILLDEDLRYIFIAENVVEQLFARNGYTVEIHRVPFGNIYHGVKKA